MDKLERLRSQTNILRPYIMVQHIQLIYGLLSNRLLLRLIWQAFLFYQVPFLSLPANLMDFENSDGPLLYMTRLCRQKDWGGLWGSVTYRQEQITCAVSRFYANHITLESPEEQVPFCWNVYQNTSQECY